MDELLVWSPEVSSDVLVSEDLETKHIFPRTFISHATSSLQLNNKINDCHEVMPGMLPSPILPPGPAK